MIFTFDFDAPSRRPDLATMTWIDIALPEGEMRLAKAPRSRRIARYGKRPLGFETGDLIE